MGNLPKVKWLSQLFVPFNVILTMFKKSKFNNANKQFPLVGVYEKSWNTYVKFFLCPIPWIYVSGLDLLEKMDPPRVIKTHLPFQLVPPGFWENKCKVRLLVY